MNTSIIKLLCTGDTKLVRVLFAAVSISWAVWLLFDKSLPQTHPLLLVLAPQFHTAVLFLVYSVALLYGAKTSHYSLTMLFIEGIMGAFLWIGSGILDSIQHGAPSPPLIGSLISLFLLIRYPTHYSGGPDAH